MRLRTATVLAVTSLFLSVAVATTTINEKTDSVEITTPFYNLEIKRNTAPSITFFLLRASVDV